ncbi:RNA-directed DNA polymerase, eukaryota, reverse transcriptase zinc-binding domain protein [Tanacetum coccineum]
MRTKRSHKIPQNLEGFVHSINSTKTKNKAEVSKKNVDKNVNQKVNGSEIEENIEDKSQDGSVHGRNCREEVAGIVRNECEGFGGDLNGDQFPPVSVQGSSKAKVSNKDCLVDDADGIEKGYDGCEKNDGVTEGSSVKGIGALASSLDKPILIDGMTAKMCAKGEGRLRFARVLIEIDASKELKKEIKVVYKGSKCHEKITKIIQVELKDKEMNEAYKVNVMQNAEKPFIVVQNRRVNFIRETQSNSKWNGYNRTNLNRRKKQDNTVGSTSAGTNRDEINENHNEKVENPKGKNTENINRENDNCLEKSLGKKDAGKHTYKRFTLLNELVGEDKLCPSTAQRKIVDEYMNMEKEVSAFRNLGWSKEMERYYKDRKELFNAANDLEQDEDVDCEIQVEEEFGMRNEKSGEDRDTHVGMSTSNKQKEVRNIIKEENLQLCGIIETHIKYHNILKIGQKVFRNWDFTSNGEDNNKGCRIMVGWNPNKLRVWRRRLWKELGSQKIITNGEPWVTMGDFNVTLRGEENSNGSLVPSNEMNEFAECIREIEVEDILSYGSFEATKWNGKEEKNIQVIFVTSKKEFLPIVKKSWEVEVDGHMMYKVVKKMKLIKPLLNKLSWKNGNIFERVTKLRECLKEVQAEVDKHPHNEDIKAKSCRVLNDYYDAMKDENNLLMQKAKIEWLKDGEMFENDKVAEQFVKNFQGFLGKKDVVTNMATDRIVFPNKLSSEEVDKMCRDVSVVEGKNAMFDIEDSKAPGPDGYTARFYNEVSATTISHVPKVQNPDRVSEFRPIACFNVIYKCISKIITNRLKGVLGRLIKKVVVKIDLQKAYDTIDWNFLIVVLEQFGFPNMMVEWIMVCVSTTKFFINIKGERECYLSGGRGLRKGDPMSPYLFTLVMEAFNIIMRKNISENKEFKYHYRCHKLGITHLCFVDDLLVFCHGDTKLVSVIKDALEEFSSYSALKANMSKSILCDIVTSREIYEAGLRINTTIADLVTKYEGNWPEGWSHEYPILNQCVVPRLQEGTSDKPIWVDKNSKENLFSVREDWKDLNCEETKVDWYRILKIAGFEVKDSSAVREVESRWNIQIQRKRNRM